MNRPTHTYAVLNVSQQTYDEIRSKLQTAAYDHAFHEDGKIDMHGIALQADGLILGKVVAPRTNLAPVITGGLQQDRCIWCGKLLSEHADSLDSIASSRMPCQGLKSGFQGAG